VYNILFEFGTPLKLVRLAKLYPNETYSRIRAAKHLSDMFTIKNGETRRCFIAIVFQRCFRVSH